VTFSRATHVEQKMRIPLGILAGATVGLLIQPEMLNTIQGVTSIGIAFGLGFSVDLFFDLLEGLMARLRGTSATSPVVPPPLQSRGQAGGQGGGGREFSAATADPSHAAPNAFYSARMVSNSASVVRNPD
jgi:hypothetical protein